jgi:anti-repressor protein
MNTLIPITQTEDGRQAVSGRALHQFLEVSTEYRHWFKRMAEYGFTEGEDYTVISDRVDRQGRGTVERQDHALTLDMAKEVSMIQRNEKGRQARQYFIECERRAKEAPALTEEEVVHRALQITHRKVRELEAQAEENAPKVEYHDTFVADEDLIQFRTLANQVDIGEQELRRLLAEHGWIYNDRTQRWSNKRERLVWESRWRASADKKRYFRLIPNHKVPRLNGEVRQTLKITPDGVTAVTRAVRKWLSVQEELDVA